MEQNTQQNTKLMREYLLGKLITEADRNSIEISLMTDDDYLEALELQEDEIIQDYVGSRLNAEDKILFEKNFLVSESRREKVRFAGAWQRHIAEYSTVKNEEESKRKAAKESFSLLDGLLSSRFAFAIFLIFAVVSGFAIWKMFVRGAGSEEVLAKLNKAYQKERPFEARISGFEYAPVDKRRGGGTAEKQEVDDISRQSAKNLSSELAGKTQTADSFHSLGQVFLADKEFDNAIDQLEKARSLAPQNAEIINDLGVAYLEKSTTLNSVEKEKNSELSSKALDAFDKSIALAPFAPAARFNKAICLQILKRPGQEIQVAWQDYLNIDNRSQWAKEARQNLKSA